MKPYVIKQGDYLEKVAHALGFDADEVWNEPKNAELKKQRDPNLLHPGDVLYVPDRTPQWLPLRSGTDNLYIAKVPRTTVRLVFKDVDKPRANEPYVILGMGEPEEGTTDGDGVLEIKVPVHIREVQISFPKSRITYPIHIGDMDPIEEPTGVRKRLLHLGYGAAPSADEDVANEDLEAADRLAILAFQQDQGLEATGSMDDATRAALAKAHDG
ncbi:Hypothetical protein A7982_11592 [Minicystis rosea]|nr:Hypothetical protein A7982_11592 [Minicystis rosea]